MKTLQTYARVDEDGNLRIKAPEELRDGQRHRLVVVYDETPETERSRVPKLPDMKEFRRSLAIAPYPGNSVIEAREEERF